VRDETSTALIVAEGVHPSSPTDMVRLTAAIAEALQAVWSINPKPAILSSLSPRFDF